HGLALRCSTYAPPEPPPELGRADVVVNAAGPRVRPGLSWTDYFREHVGLSCCIARAMRPGSHLIHLSSTAVYGARGGRLQAATPEAPLAFPNPSYACAKLAAELAVRTLARERGLALSVVRPSMVYGPGIESALATVLKLARRGIRLRLQPGSIRQHLLHVDLFERAIEVLVASGPRTQELLVLADPFVATNDELFQQSARKGRSLAVPLPVSAAQSLVRRWFRFPAQDAPSLLAALAVRGLDNDFDWHPTFAALSLDPGVFSRRATLDAYLLQESSR